MSFHIEFACAPERVAAQMAAAHAPQSVKDFIEKSLAGIAQRMATLADKKYVVTVSAVGHMCDGPGSYEKSEAVIIVKPLILED